MCLQDKRPGGPPEICSARQKREHNCGHERIRSHWILTKLNDSNTSHRGLQMENKKAATSTGLVLRTGELSGMGSGRGAGGGLEDRVCSLIGWKQALPLGVFQNGIVAEVVLVRSLNAEGPLSSHASHRLAHVERAHVLNLGQTDVQRTEGTWQFKKKKKNSFIKKKYIQKTEKVVLRGNNGKKEEESRNEENSVVLLFTLPWNSLKQVLN